MLEQLFGSKTRIKLLRLFLISGEGSVFYVREITRKVGEHLNSVRRELQNLKEIGLIEEVGGPPAEEGLAATAHNRKNINSKKHFKVNTGSVLYPELKALLFKSQNFLEKSLVKEIEQIGHPAYLVLTGFFTDNLKSPTDLLVVGKINRAKLEILVDKLEKDTGRNINYTLMTIKEFRYRRDLTDRFLFNILENKKIVLLDKLKK